MGSERRASEAGEGDSHSDPASGTGGNPPSPSTTGETLGDESQAERLLPLVYHELRRIASSMLRRGPAMTIQPTALVHEAFLKLSGQDSARWNDEAHFRALASIAMRRILADHARARGRIKRGGTSANRGAGAKRVDVSICADVLRIDDADPSDLHDALQDLEAASPRVAKLVIYRFFGDLDVSQAAERLGVSVSTAEADWRFARAWLKRRLSDTGEGHDQP